MLKVDCNSSSDDSVDVIDSSESEKSRVSGKARIEAYKLPNKGVINQKRIERLDKLSPPNQKGKK